MRRDERRLKGLKKTGGGEERAPGLSATSSNAPDLPNSLCWHLPIFLILNLLEQYSVLYLQYPTSIGDTILVSIIRLSSFDLQGRSLVLIGRRLLPIFFRLIQRGNVAFRFVNTTA